jgi:DNA-binding response OmpR family regulator
MFTITIRRCTMPKILIADDEPDIVTLISRYAEREGYDVTAVSDGRQAIDACTKDDFDIIVMDVMMPDTDGFTACKKIKEFKDIPVIMLSARGTEFDKLFGFEVGVDDYVTKPFSPMELMARIKVILSHKKTSMPSDDKLIGIEGIVIDTLGMTVEINGEKADLTAKEYSLLLLFVQNKGVVLSRDRILNEVWGYDSFGVDRTVDWQIKLLRSKLGEYRDCIRTIRGVGYKFEV